MRRNAYSRLYQWLYRSGISYLSVVELLRGVQIGHRGVYPKYVNSFKPEVYFLFYFDISSYTVFSGRDEA